MVVVIAFTAFLLLCKRYRLHRLVSVCVYAFVYFLRLPIATLYFVIGLQCRGSAVGIETAYRLEVRCSSNSMVKNFNFSTSFRQDRLGGYPSN
jgi:hypothetical protein